MNQLLEALKCCVADLHGIMPEIDPSGDREHPGWLSIIEAEKAIASHEKEKKL